MNNRIILDVVESTHNYLKQSDINIQAFTPIYAINQTGGRGQRGNSWEAEAGKNISFSMRFMPVDILPRQQFAISEATALAVCDTLRSFDIEACVKWPNDIYCGDYKICGILIDHSVSFEHIDRSIISVGLNVNQTKFISNAPNPISMSIISGREYNLTEVADVLESSLENRLYMTSSQARRDSLHKEYMKMLWRFDSKLHPFKIKSDSSEIMAYIHDVAADGILSLLTTDGQIHKFAFKEVEFLLGE